MLNLIATSESLPQPRRSALEKLANSTNRQVALLGAAALAIFNAGQSIAQQSVPGPRAMAAKPAMFLPVTTALPVSHAAFLGNGSPSRRAPELRP